MVSFIPFKDAFHPLIRKQFIGLANLIANTGHNGVTRLFFLIAQVMTRMDTPWILKKEIAALSSMVRCM